MAADPDSQYAAAQAAAVRAAAAQATAAQAAAAQANATALRYPRRGAGGRWLVWVLRAVVWAVVLVVGFQGVRSIVTSFFARGTGSGAAASAQPGGFPVALAQAYALEFGRVYLNFDPATAARRASALAEFLPPGTDPALGYDGVGAESAQDVQVAGVEVAGAHRAVVTLLARVNGHLIELGVPIYATASAMVVTGEPALLPAPATIALAPKAAGPGDPAVAAALTPRLAAFFRAFAASDQGRLRPFLVRGVRIRGLGGAVAFGAMAQVSVPASGGATRQVLAVVTWRVPGRPASGSRPSVAIAPAVLEMTYAVTVVRSGGIWYVESVGAAAAPPGPGPGP